MANTPQGPPGEPVTSTPQEHLGDSVKLVLTPPDEEPSQSNPDEESQSHDTQVTIPEVNEYEGEGDGEGDKSDITEVASSVDESRIDTPPTVNSKPVESETQKLTNEEIPNQPVVFITSGGDGESETGGEDKAGNKDGSEVISGGEDNKGEEEQSSEVKVEVKSSDKQVERSPTKVKSKTTSEVKRYKTLVISTI